MTTRTRVAATAAASLALIVPAIAGTTASAATKVTAIDAGLTPVNLLNVNDFHGRIDGGSLDGVLGKQVACTIETAKKALGDDKTAFLSAGDNVGASTFASFIASDEPTIDFLNALELKASAVGNHEFDTGFGDLTTRIIPHAEWAYLGANVYERGTTTPALPEYEVITVNGVRVGVIGVVTEQTPQMVSPSGVSGLDFGDPVTALNRVADQLTAQDKADIIVAEVHEGPNGSTSLATEMANSAVFAHIVNDTSAKVSVIFNGHTHQLYTWDGPTPSGTRSVSQAQSYGSYVTQLQLGYDPATKSVKQYVATNIETKKADLATCAGDPQYDAAAKIVTDAVAQAKVLGAVPVGTISADITRAWTAGSFETGFYAGGKPEDRQRESALGNLEAQVWYEAMNKPGRLGADIGIQNPGGVRADLLYKASSTEGDGVVTYAEAAAINPFANTMMTFDITGAQLKQTLEQQWQPAGASRAFLNLGLSQNVRYTFDVTRAAGDRITGVWVDGKPVNPTASYRIATNSFLAGGGDNFGALAEGTNYADSGVIDMDAFITWLESAGAVAPNFTKQGVEVQNVEVRRNAGNVSVKALVQGTDLSSNLSPHNTSFDVRIGGTKVASVPISAVHVDGVPTRDGQAQVSLKLRISELKSLNRYSELVLVAPQTDTRVTFTIKD